MRVVLPVLVALLLAGCGEKDEPASAPPPPKPESEPKQDAATATAPAGAAPTAAAAGTRRGRLEAHRSRFGTIVTDGGRYTLYVFTRDPGRSRCYGECARAWPPMIVKRKPAAGKGIRRGKIGVTRRRGGKLQATYGGRPLYYYVGDSEPGVILCQDVVEFGGTWYVVSPRGSAIR